MSKKKNCKLFNIDTIVIILKPKKMNDNKILVKYNVHLRRCFSVNKKAALVVSKLVSKLYSNVSLDCFEYM